MERAKGRIDLRRRVMDDGLRAGRSEDPAEIEARAGAQRWPLNDRPGFLARRMHQIHVSLFAERCAAFGVTPLQYSLLSILRDFGEADQTTLAGAVALDRTTTTGALKRLAARRLVSRSTSALDRRAQICRLTAEGAALHGAMEPAARLAHAVTVEALTPAEQDHLTRLLRRVIEGHEHRRGQAIIA
jgi:DNA-binding MarR family transcriptional regulator